MLKEKLFDKVIQIGSCQIITFLKYICILRGLYQLRGLTYTEKYLTTAGIITVFFLTSNKEILSNSYLEKVLLISFIQ